MSTNQQFAVVYSQTPNKGPAIQSVEVVGDMSSALDFLANIRLGGGTPVGVFEKVPGEVVFTAKLMTVADVAKAKSNGNGNGKVKRTPVQVAQPVNGKVHAPVRVRGGQKRSPTQIQQTRKAVQEWINANPGERIETIAGDLKVPTKDLTTPINHLLIAGVVTKTGTRRATRYFPVDGNKPVVASRRVAPIKGKKGRNGKAKK